MKEKDNETKRIKKKKFYLLFLFMMLSVLLVLITSMTNKFVTVVADFIILLIQYLTLDALFSDYFGE